MRQKGVTNSAKWITNCDKVTDSDVAPFRV